MRAIWKLGFVLAGAAAVALVAVGVTYLSVDSRSLPSALGKVAGSSTRHTERGLFAVMVGGLLLLFAIGLNQFQPGGALSLGKGRAAGGPAPSSADDPGLVAQPADTPAPNPRPALVTPPPDAPAGDPRPALVAQPADTRARDPRPALVTPPPDAPAGDPRPAPVALEADRPARTQYIGRMDDETQADPIMGLHQRRREERRAVEEAGGGESEGFELAEQDLIQHASHGDEHTPSKIMRDAVGPDEESVDSVNGEADAEHLAD